MIRTKRINITFADEELLNTLDQILDRQHTTRSRFFRSAARNYIQEYDFLIKGFRE
jgi:metal-responsive CopG/Arc/MetJ family transcriptional regulator